MPQDEPSRNIIIKVDGEEAKSYRKKSPGSVDSLESNPAAFSDDDAGPDMAKKQRIRYDQRLKEKQNRMFAGHS